MGLRKSKDDLLNFKKTKTLKNGFQLVGLLKWIEGSYFEAGVISNNL